MVNYEIVDYIAKNATFDWQVYSFNKEIKIKYGLHFLFLISKLKRFEF